jgi:branched-chain amino acid transport system substrate-binding protein
MNTFRFAAPGAALALVLALSPALAAPPAEYRIGALLAVTGPNSMLGAPERNTVEMLTEEINRAGGINGVPVKLVLYDTEGDPTKAVTSAKRLISNDRVDVIIGPTTSGESLAIVDMVEKEEIPLVSCAAAAKIVLPVKKWVFKSPQSDVLAVERIFARLKGEGKKKIAIITVANGYGDAGRIELLRAAPDYGLTIVAEEKYGEKDTDMSAQLTKVKGTDAEALVCWGTNPGPGIIAKNRKQLGLAIPLYNSHGVAARKFIEVAGDSADGTFLPAGKLIIADQLPDSDVQKKALIKYKTDYEGRYREPVNTFGGHGYDAWWMAVDAIRAAAAGGGEVTRAKVRDELEKITGFAGTAGTFNMSPADHNGLGKDSFVMVTIEKGDWKLVK